MSALRVEERPGGVRFEVRVQPRASRTELAGLYGEAVKVRLAAPPVEGAANEALIGFVADRLGVAKGDVRIVRGGRSRSKVLEVEGISASAARARLEG